MIALLTGTVVLIASDHVIVDVHGVGYHVHVTEQTLVVLPNQGSTVTLHIHTHVREDQIALFGFATRDERALFLRLLTVSNVGPKLALAILSSMEPQQFALAVQQQDMSVLLKIPGIGKKTAEKLCFELSEKLGGLSGLDGLGNAVPLDAWEGNLRSALTNLGFKEDTVLPIIAELRTTKPPLAEAIRSALKALQR